MSSARNAAARPLSRGVTTLLAALVCGSVAIGAILGADPATAEPRPKPIASGWLPYWMTSPTKPQAVMSAVGNADLLSEVSPFWYSAVKGGANGVQVVLNPNFTNGAANEAWAMDQLRAAGVKVWPAIADGSGAGTMAALLADPTRRAAHVGEIVNLAVSRGYDGIDLDYETFAFTDGRQTWSATQPNWTAFVTELANALHAQGKQLSVTIPGPCSMSGQCGPTSGYWVYNLAGIAPAADRVRIMAYDYSVSGAGAIAPLPWVEAMAAYGASAAPGKVQIGIPTYGRAWTKKSGSKYELSGTCPRSSGSSSERKAYQSLTASASITDAEIPGVLASLGIPPEAVVWDAQSAESTVEYDKSITWTDGQGASQTCVARRVMWWVGPQAVLARAQLVAKYPLAGFALWTIGGEDPAQWQPLRDFAFSLAPAATEVSLTVPPAAAYGSVVTITALAVSAGAPVAGVPATLQFLSDGRKTWSDVATTPTGADGSIAFAVPITAQGSWRVFVPGATGRAEQASAPQAIAVQAQVRTVVKGAPKGVVKRGARVSVRAIVAPAAAGQLVVLQVQRGTRWKTVDRARAGAKGVATLVLKVPGAKGPVTYRVVAAPRGGHIAGVSAFITLRVR